MAKDQGSAAIHIALTNGIITVRHSDHKGEVLLEVETHGDSWNEIWLAIRSCGTITGGCMS